MLQQRDETSRDACRNNSGGAGHAASLELVLGRSSEVRGQGETYVAGPHSRRRRPCRVSFEARWWSTGETVRQPLVVGNHSNTRLIARAREQLACRALSSRIWSIFPLGPSLGMLAGTSCAAGRTAWHMMPLVVFRRRVMLLRGLMTIMGQLPCAGNPGSTRAKTAFHRNTDTSWHVQRKEPGGRCGGCVRCSSADPDALTTSWLPMLCRATAQRAWLCIEHCAAESPSQGQADAFVVNAWTPVAQCERIDLHSLPVAARTCAAATPMT